MEIWKSIEGYEKLYEVSNLGRVRNSRTGRILKPWLDRNGYEAVKLCKEGSRKNKFVHRVAAISFLSNPYNKSQVNHIDENPQNNKLENLEWATPKENINHSIEKIRRIRRKDRRLSDLQVLTIRTMKDVSCKKFAKLYGVNHDAIHKARTGKRYADLPLL